MRFSSGVKLQNRKSWTGMHVIVKLYAIKYLGFKHVHNSLQSIQNKQQRCTKPMYLAPLAHQTLPQSACIYTIFASFVALLAITGLLGLAAKKNKALWAIFFGFSLVQPLRVQVVHGMHKTIKLC